MRFRRITRLGAWALFDQILSSATNFGAGLVVARTLGPVAFGSFTVVFGSWIVLLGITRAMLVQPYTVVASGAPAPSWRSDTRATSAAVLVVGLLFGVCAMGVGVLLGAGTPTGSAFIALGLAAAPLALQDFWRFAAFSLSAPRLAAANDGTWAVVQVVVLAWAIATHRLTPATAIAAWGLGALAGALLGLRQFRLRPSLGVTERRFIRTNARLAGWFGISNFAYLAGYYGTLLLVGAGAGTLALGGLGSTVNLMSPALLVASSAESIMLPIAARTAKEGRLAALRKLCKVYSIAFAGFFAFAGAGLVLVGPAALRIVYGNNYVRFASLLPAVVAAAAVSGLASGLVLGFRALAEGRRLALLQTASSVARLALVAVSLSFGLVAIAWAIALAEVLRTALAWVGFGHAISRREQSDPLAPEPDVAVPPPILSA